MRDSIPNPMPPWRVSQWFNSDPLQMSDLRGRVVLIHTFQMLCPGCVMHSIPQAIKVHRLFGSADLAVVGLHTVFEHHDAMRPHALQAFLHEYRVDFPVGVDEPSESGIPHTMARLGLQGTPSTLLLDRSGRIRLQHFGQIDDLQLGFLIGRLVSQAGPGEPSAGADASDADSGQSGPRRAPTDPPRAA